MSYPDTYDAVILGQQGRWWVVDVPSCGPDAVTQALTLEEVPETVLDYISVYQNRVLPAGSTVRLVRWDLYGPQAYTYGGAGQ